MSALGQERTFVLAAWEDLTPRDENTLNVYARSLKKEPAALVVGWAVLIERISH
jgi:hypothetical protein